MDSCQGEGREASTKGLSQILIWVLIHSDWLQFSHIAGEISSHKSQLKTWETDAKDYADANKNFTDQLIKVKVYVQSTIAVFLLNKITLDVRHGEQRPGEVRKGPWKVCLLPFALTHPSELFRSAPLWSTILLRWRKLMTPWDISGTKLTRAVVSLYVLYLPACVDETFRYRWHKNSVWRWRRSFQAILQLSSEYLYLHI